MKIATVQMDTAFADVDKNLAQAEKYIEKAAALKAQLILFPELFTSAIGFSPKMLQAALWGQQVSRQLARLSSRHQIIVGGSFLRFDGDNAYNVFQLVFPDGQIFTHKKDIPTQIENCYYTDGDTEHILHTPLGDIGVALCWEMLRYDTVRRLSGKAVLILSCSCWWDLPDAAPAESEPLRRYNRDLALQTPAAFAKMLHVPLIHASHCGKVTAYRFPDADESQTRQLVGAAQIIGFDGSTMVRRTFDEGEGMVIADVNWGGFEKRPQETIPQKYWIPDLPDSYLRAWEQINPQGKAYYNAVALPYYKEHYANDLF